MFFKDGILLIKKLFTEVKWEGGSTLRLTNSNLFVLQFWQDMAAIIYMIQIEEW